MHTKHKFAYTLLGGMIGIVGTLIGMTVSPLTAQDEVSGHIVCTGLSLVNESGVRVASIGYTEEGGAFVVADNAGNLVAGLGADKHGGFVKALDKANRTRAIMASTEHGGAVYLADTQGRNRVTLGMLQNRDPDDPLTEQINAGIHVNDDKGVGKQLRANGLKTVYPFAPEE